MKNNLLLILMLAFLTLSSCKNKEDIPESIPFTTNKNLPIMTGKLNGIRATFLIDSGAEVSSIGMHQTLKYDFTLIPSGFMMGIGGMTPSYKAVGAKLFYDGYPIDVEFKAFDLRGLSARHGAIGILGADYLIKHDLILDYKNNVLRKSNILD
jgi:hypothetical protein